MTPVDVVVVGGGLAGLTAAFHLIDRSPALRVQVLEAAEAPGGLLRTKCKDGYIIELGPDSIITDRPAALALAERLHLQNEILATRAEHRGAYVVFRGRLERVPQGFSLVAPGRWLSFLRSPLLSWRGKLRVGLDLVLPRGSAEEESLGAFVSRRFGHELLERLAQPLASGIYGSDPWQLSMGATLGRFAALEQEHRSVLLGLRRTATAGEGAGARYGLFVGFSGGMQTLTDALVGRLGDRVRTNAAVDSIAVNRADPDGLGWRVMLADGSHVCSRAVLVATPAKTAADVLQAVDSDLAGELRAIPHGSAATVTFAWPREAIPHPMDAFGFVVPDIERRAILACTWSSVKYPGRAPDGEALVRVFFGGPRGEDCVDWSDERLVSVARAELEALMGVRAEPRFSVVVRYPRAMPRYELGHLDRVGRIEAGVARHSGLALAGKACRGVGIPDTIQGAIRAAEQVASTLALEATDAGQKQCV